MDTNEPCPACGGKLVLKKSTFELRAFLMLGGPNKGEVGYQVTPDGLDIPTCTENRCGEKFLDAKLCEKLDAAKAYIEQTEPSFKSYLGVVREQLQHWMQKKD